MDTLKKPETIISLTNTAALLGASVYFYRRINSLEEDLDKYSEHLTNTIRKVKDMQITKQHVKQLAGAIRELNNIMGSQRNEISYLKNLSSYQRDQLKELQSQTTELGGEVKLTQDLNAMRYGQGSPNYQSRGYQPQPSPQIQPAPQQFQSPQQFQPVPSPQQFQPVPPPQQYPQQFPSQQSYQPVPSQQSYQPVPSQQQYPQQNYQPQQQYDTGLLGSSSLIDFANNQHPNDEDDLDLQIDAVRRARNQNNSSLQQGF